jgi:hypothetical protein
MIYRKLFRISKTTTMTEEKKKNPILVALEAKKKNALLNSTGKTPKSQTSQANSKGQPKMLPIGKAQ